MNIKVNFDKFDIKETHKNNIIKILMLKGEKGDSVSAEWGTVSGNITDQTDLKEALDSKANQSDLNTTNNNLSNLTEAVATNTNDIASNTNDIASNTNEITTARANFNNLDARLNAKPYSFDSVLNLKNSDLKIGDIALINNSTYSIIDTENATSVTMTFNSTKNRYELVGVSSQSGTPTISNPVEFVDTYNTGIYKTTINNKVYVFELKESLKSLNNIQDIFWIDIVNETMGIDKNINEIMIDGSEGWEIIDNSSYSEDILRFRTSLFSNVFNSTTTTPYISSNKLEGIYLGTRTQNGIARQLNLSGINIFIDKSLLSTEDISGFVTFLSSINPTVRYRYIVTETYNYEDITLNNGLLAKKYLQINDSFPQKNIFEYKEYVIDNDWLPAFNKALSENIKSLYVPTGTYNISDTFVVNNGMKIYGDGIDNTIIKLVSSSSTANAIIEFNYSDYSSLEDVALSSLTYGTELIAGLYIHFSDKLYLNNISINNINGSGLYVEFETSSNSSYDCKINNIDIHDCTGHGFFLQATDLFLSNCIAYRVQKHGFYFTKSNSLLVNCKAYWTGTQGDETTGDGYYLETENYSTANPQKIGHKTRMVNCEAQECGRYGFSLINTDSCQLIGCQCDTNGMYCENIIPYGYYLKNNRNLKLIGSVVNQNLVGWQKIPLYFEGGNDNNIQITAQVLEYGTGYYKFYDDLYTVINYNPSNKIFINNHEIYKPDYQNDLYAYNNTTGVATDFTFAQTGTITSSSIIDFNSMSQKLTINYITGSAVNANAKIYQDFNISSDNFNKISISVLTKNDNLYVAEFLRFRFYDSNDTQLYMKTSTFNLYGNNRDNKHLSWHTLYLDYEIPSNTTKVRVELFTALQSSGVTAQQGGSTWFKDFKLCCYNQ